jgi:hypothetical protein
MLRFIVTLQSMVINLTDIPDSATIDVLKPLAAWAVHLKDSAATPQAYEAADRVLKSLDAEIYQRRANLAKEAAQSQAVPA